MGRPTSESPLPPGIFHLRDTREFDVKDAWNAEVRNYALNLSLKQTTERCLEPLAINYYELEARDLRDLLHPHYGLNPQREEPFQSIEHDIAKTESRLMSQGAPLVRVEKMFDSFHSYIEEEQQNAHRRRIRNVGAFVTRVSECWMVLPENPEERLPLYEPIKVKVAKVIGLALFKKGESGFAFPVVQGKYKHEGVVSSVPNPSSFVFLSPHYREAFANAK